MYKEHDDYELLYLISENNEEAKEIFYEKYRPIIEYKSKRLYPCIRNKGYELGDLIQEGMIGLSKALNDFKEQKNVKFSTFASVCVDRQLITFIRNVNRQKHKILNDSLSIDTSIDKRGRPLEEIIFDDKNRNPEENFIDIESEEELINKIRDILTDREYEVFELRLQGFSYQEMAFFLETTPKSIDGTMRRLKNKIINLKQC